MHCASARSEAPIHVTMLAPSGFAERSQAQRRLQSAAGEPRSGRHRGREACWATPIPIVAVQEEWNPGRYDEVVVCTLAAGSSQWLQIDLPASRRQAHRLPGAPRLGAHAPARAAQGAGAAAEHRPMLERVASLMRSGSRSGAA